MDYALGLKLPALLQQRGLKALTVENEAPLCAGGSRMATVMKMSAEQLRDKYLAAGVVDSEDLERYCRPICRGSERLGHLLRQHRREWAEG